MPVAVTLADLGQFTVVSLKTDGDKTHIEGRLSKPGQFGPGDRVDLYVGLYEEVPGYLPKVDPDARTAVFTCYTHNIHPAVVPGASFALCDDYWSERIDLLLDPAIHWTRKAFVAPDAFVQVAPTTGCRQWRIAEPGDKDRADGEIVPGGWDHEHCEICWRHIGRYGDAEGYVNADDRWICTSCYARYVERRDLSFVLDGVEQESDPSPEADVYRTMMRMIDDYNLHGIRALIRSRGRADVRGPRGWTPLMIAAGRGQQSLVALLLDEGAEVNAAAEPEGYSALALAAQAGHERVVEMLLAAGASTRIAESLCGGSMLLWVKTGRGGNDARLIQMLTRAGAT